jgi:hypothetical protein
VSEVSLEISLADLRRLRTLHSPDGLHPGIRTLLPKVLAEVEELDLLRPAIAWESRRLLEVSGSRVRLAGGSELAQAEAVAGLLGAADELAMAVGSIGPALDRTTRDWFASGREVEAFVLGEVGNLAVGKLSDRIPQIVGEWAASRGVETSGALSPGGTGVDLSDQRIVVEVASAERIGVELTSACMLVPVKSVSMVIGLGHGLPTWTHAQACGLCASRDTCRLRRFDSEPAIARAARSLGCLAQATMGYRP